MRKVSRILLCLILGLSLFTNAVPIYSKEENIALHKPVIVSGVEGGYQEDGTLKYPQFVETNLTDGDLSSRWSSNEALHSLDLNDAPDQNVWAKIDLENEVEIGKIVIHWADANSRDYDVQISSNGEDWETLKHYEDPDNTGIVYTETLNVEKGVSARYIRIYARLGTVIKFPNSDFKCPTISIREVEVFEYNDKQVLEEQLDQALTLDVSMNEDQTKLILPSLGEDVSLRIYATSNASVVDVNQNVYLPYEDMKVNLFYEVCSADGKCLRSDDPKKVVIPGKYQHNKTDNPKPAVVPEIREWKGYQGSTYFNGVIVIASSDLYETAQQIAMYFKEMVAMDVEIKTGTPQNGNIYLTLNNQSVMQDEGYTLEIADIITVQAKTHKGILYGGTTLSQMLTLAEDHRSFPKGIARDYPQYEIRAVMLDVARQYIPLDYLEELTRYAGYFKLSEFRNHINDNGGEQNAAFRVESKKYPQLNEGIEVYSQEDYKAYQKDAKKYGVDVVTEIDTPAHAGAFGKIDSSLLMDGYHLDLRTEESYQKAINIMKEVFDEFLDGEDPVFQNGKFHIGTDEYDKSYSEVVRRYMNDLIEYVNEKGVECRFWASLGSKGFNGTTPVSKDVIAHMWSHSWASFDEMKEEGYSFVNNADGILYIVPFAGYYNDYLNIQRLYDTWEYSNLNGGYYLEAGHPQLLGAEAALWYDMKVGASEFDIFNRFKDQIILMAEKGWYGEKDDQSGEEFVQRVEKVGKYTPKANPARYVESKDSLVASYDFSSSKDNVIQDLSQNDYDANIVDTYCFDHSLFLNGGGYISLPMQSIGYPYTIEFDMKVDKATSENALIFEGKDGKLFYNYDGTGMLGYERKGYAYVIDATIPVGIETHFTIACDETDLSLYINGAFVGNGEYYKVSGASKQGSSTFVLPLEKIGSGIYGTLDNLKIFNYKKSSSEIAGQDVDVSESKNIALHKSVAVSGVEGGYKEDGTLQYPQFDPKHATDGDVTTRISLNRDDDAWVVIDLGKEYLLDQIKINFGQLPNAYQIQVSENNQEWTVVSNRTLLNGGKPAEEVIQFDEIVKARYVKYQQLEQFLYDGNGSKYSGNFSEFEVYGYDADKYVNTIEEAKMTLSDVEINEHNKEFVDSIQKNIEKLKAMLETGPVNEMELLNGMIHQQLALLKKGEIPEIVDKQKLEALLSEKKSKDSYSEKSWKKYNQAIMFGRSVFYNVYANQVSVDYACNSILEAKNQLNMKDYITITSNKPVYETNDLKYLIDNDKDTITWLSGNQKTNDYILFEFREPQTLSTLDIYSKNAGADVLHHGKIEVSLDGTNWTKVGNVGEKEEEKLSFDDIQVKFVRISVTEDANYWWKLSEVVFNGKTIQDKEILKKEIETKVDESLYTKESLKQYQEAVNAGKIVYEDKTAKQYEIDEAVEQIRNMRNQLQKVLDKSELKALLDAKENASIYTVSSYVEYEKAYQKAKEIYDKQDATQNDVDKAIFKLVEKTQLLQRIADYSAVKEAIIKANALNPENYEDFSAVEHAIEMVVYDLDITCQKEVDAMAEVILTAIANLKEKPETEPVTKDQLEKMIESIAILDKSIYTEESWKVLEAALNNAKNVLVDKDATQEDVTKAVTLLQKAIEHLEKKTSMKPNLEGEENNNKPNTGDTTNVSILFLMLMAASGALVLVKKKANR